MNNFVELSRDELVTIDGGALEILIGGKVFAGAAAAGIIGGAGLAIIGVAALGYYVASRN